MAAVDLQQLLGEGLLAHDPSTGQIKRVPASDIKGKTVGIYFSAHWCPPCRQFTPLLVQTYNKLRAEGKDFCVVFVSSDKNPEQFNEYFGHMPWLAVPFEDSDVRWLLSKQFKVLGIPTLVMLGPDGAVLTSSGRNAVMRDPAGENYPWEGAQGGREGVFSNRLVMLLFIVVVWKFIQWLQTYLRG